MARPPPPRLNAEAQQRAANEPQRVLILNMPLIRVKPPPPHMAAHRGPPPNYDWVPVKPPPPHMAAYRGPLPVHEAAEGLPLVKAKPPPPFWRGEGLREHLTRLDGGAAPRIPGVCRRIGMKSTCSYCPSTIEAGELHG